LELSKPELQYILNAIDTHVRSNGLNVAAVGLTVVAKIQTASSAAADEVAGQTPSGGDAGAT